MKDKNKQNKADGAYENAFLGVGTAKDRSARTRAVAPVTLGAQELASLYAGDGLAAKIVDLPAEEMVRAGFEIEGLQDSHPVASEVEGLRVLPAIATATKWARLFGGGLIVILVNDGGDLTDPVNEERIKSVEQLRVYDRYDATRYSRYDDPADRRFGQTKLWQISPASGNPYVVHESRCVVVDGDQVPDRIRESYDGWGGSVINRIYRDLIRTGMSLEWGNALLERAQQGVHAIPGLAELLAQPDGEKMIVKRVNLVDMARSVNNTVVIDAEEKYTLESTPLSGVADIMDRMGLSLAAVAKIPESLLFGRQLGGLNSTGASDLENWYARIGQEQQVTILPALDRIIGLIMRAQGVYTDDYLIKFKPLWVPSAKESAETEKTKADVRRTYVEMGSLDPSEVRSMLAGEGYDIDDAIELEYGTKETD